MEELIYLDNAATTFPKPNEVYDRMDEVNRKLAVNAGRGSYQLARNAMAIIDDVKVMLKELVKAPSTAKVVITPSITIALNQILSGISFKKGDIVYVSPYEHNAVARTLQRLSNESGIEIKLLPVNKSTLEIDINAVKSSFLYDRPICVCCTHISNVTGYILPITEIFEAAKQVGAITVLDSAQSLGLVDVTMENIDFLAFAGHKTLYGPFGVGGFIDNSGMLLKSYITGGTGSNSLDTEMPQETPYRYEASSTNIVAVAGLQAALKCLNVEENYKKEKELTQYAVERLREFEDIKLYIPNEDSHIGVISFNITSFDNSADSIGSVLDDEYHIAVRTGFHCAPYVHNLIDDMDYSGTVRVGIGKFNTKEDIDSLCEALEEMI